MASLPGGQQADGADKSILKILRPGPLARSTSAGRDNRSWQDRRQEDHCAAAIRPVASELSGAGAGRKQKEDGEDDAGRINKAGAVPPMSI